MKQSKVNSPTIYDVASLAGLSISTVSRVMNSPERVSQANREKVLAAIEELGFVPKAEARARAMQNTRRIGVITPFYFTSPSFVQRLRGVAAALASTNFEMIVYTVGSRDQLEGYLATLPLTGHLDGLIIMSLRIDETATARLAQHGLATVLIEFHQPGCSSVEIDDIQGGRLAAQYLIKNGHQRCAFLGDTDWHEYAIHPVTLRLEGFRRGLAEAGLELPEDYIRMTPYTLEQTLQQARLLLHLPEPPTAVFAAADFQAVAVLRAARENGLKIPEDVSVIGFDDLDLADFLGLTTVRQPLDDSGRIAADLLLAHLANPALPVQHVQLPLSIIERETVMPRVGVHTKFEQVTH